MSRIKNAKKNVMSAVVATVVFNVLQFVIRRAFIQGLGNYYLGIGNVFLNVMNMICIVELGLGSAVMQSMYRPIAENDLNRMSGIVRYYKKLLTIVSFVILGFGIVFSFNLNLITNETITSELIFIFYLFLINTCVNYLFVADESVVVAHQKNYIISKITVYYNLVVSIFQLAVIVFMKDYIAYLLVKLSCDIGKGLAIKAYAFKHYPFLKTHRLSRIEDGDYHTINRNIVSLAMYKLCHSVLTGTDNIIISKFVSNTAVALVANYTLVISGVDRVIRDAFHSVTSILGNVSVTENKEDQIRIYYQVFLLSEIMYGIVAVGMAVLIEPFIAMFFGSAQVMELSIALVMIVNFYLVGINRTNGIYREILGLFRYGKFRPLVMAVLNVIISVVLVLKVGVIGVYLGTVISRVLTQTWFDPLVIAHKGFDMSVSKFYGRMVYNLVVLSVIYGIQAFVLQHFVIDNVIGFVIAGCFSVAVSLSGMCLMNSVTPEGRDLFVFFIKKLKK